jgi:hypothetical protein
MIGVIAILYGAAAALLFRRLTNPSKIRASINQIEAHILEFRLFIDEPALIWRAQKAAIRANLTLLRQIALPCILLAIPLALLWTPLEHRFGHRPLNPGETTILTAHTDLAPTIDGLTIETPGVRIPRTREVVWRVRAVRQINNAPDVRFPPSNTWILWFIAISSLTAIVVQALSPAHRQPQDQLDIKY